MPVANQGFFFTYTLPADAVSYDVGEGDSHGYFESQRNNIAVDWTTRKWYFTGWVYNATFDYPPDNWGLWVGDLDNLTQMSFLPFDRTSVDPFTPANGLRSTIGLVAFENTNYLALAVQLPNSLSSASGSITHILINRTTGAVLSSASTTNADTGQNNEVPPFLLPTADSNVFFRFDFSTHHTTGANKWAVIKYDLSTETVTIPVDYAAVPALLDDANRAFIANGQVGDTFNTVYMIDPDTGAGKIFEITIPHSTASDTDLSAVLLATVAAVSGESMVLRAPYYDSTLDRLVYGYKGSAFFQTQINYAAVSREAPETILWTTTVAPEEGPFILSAESNLQYGGYQFINVTGCACLDPSLGQAININDGTVQQIARITNFTRGAQFTILDMAENRVYPMGRVREDLIDTYFADTLNFPAAGHDSAHVDTGEFITFMVVFRSPNDLFYPEGACEGGGGEPAPEDEPCPIPGLGSEACIIGRTSIPPGTGQIVCGLAAYVDPCG